MVMDYMTIIGLLSGVITVISFIFYLKDKFRKSYIEFDNNETFPLFNNKFDKINLEILYRGQEIKNNIYYFKCKITNHSFQDISKYDLISPLKIHFKKGKVLECFAERDDKIDLDFVISDKRNDVTISWDLFKNERIIEFGFIVEFADSKKRIDIYNDIDLDYRIKNVNGMIKSGGIYNAKFFYNVLLTFSVIILLGFIYQHIKYPIFNKDATNIQMIEQKYMNVVDSSEVVLTFGLSPYQVEKFKCTPDNVGNEYILVANDMKSSKLAYWGHIIMLLLGPIAMIFAIWYFAKKIHSIKQ